MKGHLHFTDKYKKGFFPVKPGKNTFHKQAN